jgi:hypothetical protein
MMKKLTSILSAATLGVCASLIAPTASAVIIDFDSISAGTLLNTPLEGVTFSLANGELPRVDDTAEASTSSPRNALLNAELFSFAEPADDITMDFGGAVNNLSFTLTFENDIIDITVLQGASSTAIVLPFDGDPTGDFETIDLSAFSGITSVTLSSRFSPDADYYFIDDVTFDRAVPVPAAALLLVTGLLVMGVRRRRAA